jgi:NAD(P)-dependent dehydrogenase (short-subunit alcohol dehydrogenase family)
MSIANRVFLVTGAAGNVGRTTTRRLLAAGARVAAVDRQEPAPPDSSVPPSSFAGIRADLSSEPEVDAAFDAAEKKLGPLWAVLHIAGTWKGGRPVQDTDLELYESLMGINLRSSFLVGRAAMRRFAPRGGGRIVMVGAYSAATFIGVQGSGAYNVSKAGVIALTKILAAEGREHGVFANCVAPNTIATEANRAAMPTADASRWVPVEAVADALLMAASPESGLNGTVLLLSGR